MGGSRITVGLATASRESLSEMYKIELNSEWQVVCFPKFFQLPDKCHNIWVAFLENVFFVFTIYVVYKLLLHNGRVKMDEYYGMF